MLRRPILIVIFLLSYVSWSQETNTTIVAEITTQSLGEFLKVEATASSKTEIIKSIRYVLYVFKEDANKNVSRTEQGDRLVLQPNEKKTLSVSSFNKNDKDKLTVMLLLYDEEDKLIGRARRVVLNDGSKEPGNAKKEVLQTEDDIYSGLLRGIITEETKTKPGRDFYIEFSSLYRLQQINGIEVVKVLERFSFGRNTIMEVKVANTVVHRFLSGVSGASAKVKYIPSAVSPATSKKTG